MLCPLVVERVSQVELKEITKTVIAYCQSAPKTPRECDHLGALMQVAFKTFGVDFREPPWKCGLALMPRRIPWRRPSKG